MPGVGNGPYAWDNGATTAYAGWGGGEPNGVGEECTQTGDHAIGRAKVG